MSGRSPRLLVLGHVTRDLFGSEARLGGAAAFAAQAAVLLGIDTALVTVAPLRAPELEPLRRLAALQLAVAPSEHITTFGIEYRAGERELSLLERARSLTWEDIPPAWRAPELLYVGPVAAECDEHLVEAFGETYGIGCIQGWLRDPVPGGRVRPLELPAARHPPKMLKAISFSASDHPQSSALAEELARTGITVAVTSGRQGIRVWSGQTECWVPATAALEVDPTGAGDVFALVFGVSLWMGLDPRDAARRGARAAARVVEGPGLGNLAAACRDILPR